MNRKLIVYKLQRAGGGCKPVQGTIDSAWERLMMNLTGSARYSGKSWPGRQHGWQRGNSSRP
jgi:hypothetical protein